MIREELLALADEIDADAENIAGYLDSCEGNFSKSDVDEYYKFAGWVNRIREAVERDGEGATTVSAYDLLSEDEREAIAWVREHGGLGAVEKRLMPEGMEWLLEVWPKWSNGEYCKFGDWWKADKYGECEPQQLSMLAFYTPEQLREWGQDEGDNYGYEWNCMRPSDTTYRPDKAETPAPKALAADGKPLEVGQTVWRDDGEMLEVLYLRPDGLVDCCGEIERPERLTHERPVLGADGVEIRVGDTVYVLGFGEPLTVKGFTDDGRVLMSFHDENSLGYKPSKLTHEQPDTWERLEHDAEKTVCEYFGANYDCANCPLEPDRCDEEAKKDIIRRAKKLAERGA